MWCNPLHRVTSNQFNPILMVQSFASIWAPVIIFLSFHEQGKTSPIHASWMCVKPSGTITTPKLQHQKTLHQRNFWQFKWCNVLHRVTSNKFPTILVAQHCDPPYRAIGYGNTYPSTFFRVSQGIALYPPWGSIAQLCWCLKALGGGGVSQVKAALSAIGRYRGGIAAILSQIAV